MKLRILDRFDWFIEAFMLLTLGSFLLALSGAGAYLWARAFEIVVGVWW